MRSLVIGGAGFIGSHLVDRLVERGPVVVLDDLSAGRREFIDQHIETGRARLVVGDVLTARAGDLSAEPEGYEETGEVDTFDVVYHLAANPEARAGLKDHELDIRLGTVATQRALEIAVRVGAKRFVLASSGTVYGDAGHTPCAEGDLGRLPASLYGASKLASEALVSAYVECCSLPRATIVRFGNVVGPRATHGCILDFCRKLRATPDRLEVLGNGSQSKPYLHVTDCCDGILRALDRGGERIDIFNVAPADSATVTTIAEECVRRSSNPSARIDYGFRDYGWAGDVPTSRLNPAKLAALGWTVSMTSTEAVKRAVREVALETFGAA